MIYLSTPPTTPAHRELVASGGLGVMLTPRVGRRVQAAQSWPVWAADNGCFTAGASFNLDRYLAWLQRMCAVSGCLFATAPDVVGDAAATWERSRDVLPRLRSLGYRAALVLQNNIGSVDWSSVDAVFVGGDDGFKFSREATDIAQDARRRGVWTHMGRVNSWARWERCAEVGYDSADGTCVAFGPDANLPRVRSWIERDKQTRFAW